MVGHGGKRLDFVFPRCSCIFGAHGSPPAVCGEPCDCGDWYLRIGGTVLGSPVSGHRRARRSRRLLMSVKKRDMAL
jgi:hypothetical protein